MPGTVVTIPEAAAILAAKYSVSVSESTLRRRVDAMGIVERIGQYRVFDKSHLKNIARLLKKEGFLVPTK